MIFSCWSELGVPSPLIDFSSVHGKMKGSAEVQNLLKVLQIRPKKNIWGIRGRFSLNHVLSRLIKVISRLKLGFDVHFISINYVIRIERR